MSVRRSSWRQRLVLLVAFSARPSAAQQGLLLESPPAHWLEQDPCGWRKGFLQTSPWRSFLKTSELNSSVLAVIVEERYAERLDEEIQKFGRTARRELKRAERDAEFDAYLQRSKDKIRSIQNDIQAQLAKAQAATGAEKTRIAADLAAKRAELEARREKLEDHIKEMNSGLQVGHSRYELSTGIGRAQGKILVGGRH